MEAGEPRGASILISFYLPPLSLNPTADFTLALSNGGE